MPNLVLDATLCVYGMDWKDKSTGEVTRHFCQESIDLDKLAPYRVGPRRLPPA